jgi:hypothetical protein
LRGFCHHPREKGQFCFPPQRLDAGNMAVSLFAGYIPCKTGQMPAALLSPENAAEDATQ